MPAPFTIIGLDHVVLRARDPAALEQFYINVLGCSLELRQGDPQAARLRLRQLLDLVPASYEGRSLLAQVELLHGDAAAAAVLYGRLAAESPGYAELTNLGLAHLLAGGHRRACP